MTERNAPGRGAPIGVFDSGLGGLTAVRELRLSLIHILKFTHKVTARNLFRYKKRFFMTVIGVAGCTALLVTGFGPVSYTHLTHLSNFVSSRSASSPMETSALFIRHL